ncbi:hypothetical protein BRO54_2785 [Geobacillus proteiniphilus]|uniref:Uncharacterized protein n=2 Tax=Geobacillus TaxID=129337 RepID=A0A1Q5STT7_9BACL|nr:hypothetical protein BRO54_2785 [Geobacillus proteiniphilus]
MPALAVGNGFDRNMEMLCKKSVLPGEGALAVSLAFVKRKQLFLFFK